jgi:PST family polysaccharide transporter
LAEESFQNNFFDTEYLKADLKGRSVRGGAVTMAAQRVRFFLQMVSTVVLARMLTPQDYGLIAMVTNIPRSGYVF